MTWMRTHSYDRHQLKYSIFTFNLMIRNKFCIWLRWKRSTCIVICKCITIPNVNTRCCGVGQYHRFIWYEVLHNIRSITCELNWARLRPHKIYCMYSYILPLFGYMSWSASTVKYISWVMHVWPALFSQLLEYKGENGENSYLTYIIRKNTNSLIRYHKATYNYIP